MARRPYAALGTITTPHGPVIVRKQIDRDRRTWFLVLEGAHDALRSVLPDWQPRAPATRTQVTPPQPCKKVSQILEFAQLQVARWVALANRPSEPAATPVPAAVVQPTYRTLGDLVAVVDHETATSLRSGTLTTYRHQWATLMRSLPADTPLHQLSRERLQALMGELAERFAATTVANLRAAMNKLMQRAVEDVALVRNPLTKVKTPKPIVRPRAFLTRSQRDAILVEASRHGHDVHLLFAVLFFTGVRKSEALALTWPDVDVVKRVLHVRNSASFTTKSGRSRTVPLCEELHAWLVEHRRPSGFVLKPDLAFSAGRYRWNFATVFANVVRVAGTPHVTPHLCRHTFASLFLESGGSFFKLAAYLGHGITETTELYSHCVPGFDADIDRLSTARRDRQDIA